MMPIPVLRIRRFVVACTLLGLAVASGCGEPKPPNASDAPPSRLVTKLKGIQEKKPKTEAAK